MPDEPAPKKTDLIPVEKRGLAKRSAGLVKRGLEALASQQPRIVHFPPDHSVGQYLIFDRRAMPPVKDICGWLRGSSPPPDHKIGEAKGTVTLLPGKIMCLNVSSSAAQDVSLLPGLNPQDVHTLVVDLSRTQVTNEELKHLQNLVDLRQLFLRDTIVSDGGWEYLHNLRNLEFLDLFGTNVNDDGVSCLRNLVNLSWLSLGRSGVGDDGMKYLQDLPKLWFLSLRFTKVGDRGIAYLQKLSNLFWLTLRGTDVGDDGLKYLQNFSKLKILDLRETKVTDKGLDQIKQALPNCRLNWDIV